jgi:SET domain-containing protein
MSIKIVDQETVQEGVVAQTEWVEFRRSRIHGMGGYARKFIPKETYVIEYMGEKIDKKEAERRCEADNRYIFVYDDEYDLDGSVDWNLARWINHSCEANCETLDDEGKIWIMAMRDIEAGEELSFNYCYDLDEYQDHPCRCGSDNCVGYILAEEHHDEVRARLRAQKRRKKKAVSARRSKAKSA